MTWNLLKRNERDILSVWGNFVLGGILYVVPPAELIIHMTISQFNEISNSGCVPLYLSHTRHLQRER